MVILDSGATHNFITPAMVSKTKSKLITSRNLDIKLGTGVEVKGLGVCKSVEFCLQGLDFTADLIVLELGGADVILGIQWLRTLGKCEVDWSTHELSFIIRENLSHWWVILSYIIQFCH